MGLVQRQGLKYSIVNWVGVLIGVLSTMFVYPRALDEYGLLRFIIDTSTLIFPVLSLGVNSLTIRFFPKFEDKESGHHGFLALMILWGLSGYLLFAGIAWFFWPSIQSFYTAKNPIFSSYLWMLFPVSLMMLLNNIMNQYAINFKRIVIPSLLFDFSQKIALPLLVLSYWLHWIDLHIMLTGVMVYLVLVTIGFVYYIISLKAWNWRIDFTFVNWKMIRSMLEYALFGIVGGAGFLLISRLDGWMVGTFVDLKHNGIYSISSFIANVMDVPSRALIGITIPLIAAHWNNENVKEIEILYKKTSINLLLAGLLLFGAFWVSVTPFFNIIANGPTLLEGKTVILLLGIAKLVDMATGLNNYVLNYSKHYRYSYIQICIPAIAGTLLSIWLVPIMGITGAAIGTLCASVCYNLISFVLNWYFFRMQPFSIEALKALFLALICFGLSEWLPNISNPWLAIMLKSGVYTAVFSCTVLWFELSPDLNSMLRKFLKS
jgi:O-antigen/teichoic acid export membrane protein